MEEGAWAEIIHVKPTGGREKPEPEPGYNLQKPTTSDRALPAGFMFYRHQMFNTCPVEDTSVLNGRVNEKTLPPHREGQG